MRRAILNKSWRQHPTRHQLYGHLPPITKTIQVRRTRLAGYCRRSRDELISDVLLWTPTYGRAKAGWPARTYIQQLCDDTGCSPEDLPEAMNDREKWRERIKDIRAGGTTWWWGWWWWWFLRNKLSFFKTGYVGLDILLLLQGNTRADYVLRTSIGLMNGNGFTQTYPPTHTNTQIHAYTHTRILTYTHTYTYTHTHAHKSWSRRYPVETITDADNVDDQVLFATTCSRISAT